MGAQSNYSTFQAPLPIIEFFGSRGPNIPSNPLGLAASGISGGFNLKTSTGAAISDAASVASPNFTSTWRTSNAFTGSAAANAQFGKIGAEAHGVFNGWGDGFSVTGSDGFATFREPLAFTDPAFSNGTAGFVNLRFTIDGSMSQSGVGIGGVEVLFQQNSGPIYNLMRASVDGGNFSPTAFYPYESGTGRDGFALSSTSVSGSGAFDTGKMPMIWGTAFDFKLGLLAYVNTGKDSTVDVNFGSTSLLTGIDVFDAAGNRVDGFSIASGSGTRYDAAGVHFDQQAVPEPSTLVLMGTGLLALFGMRRCRRKSDFRD